MRNKKMGKVVLTRTGRLDTLMVFSEISLRPFGNFQPPIVFAVLAFLIAILTIVVGAFTDDL